MLWVTNTMVLPSFFQSLRMLSSRAERVSSSSAENGSSMSITSEPMASKRAIATRCFIPPESVLGRASATSESPTWDNARRARSAVSAESMTFP